MTSRRNFLKGMLTAAVTAWVPSWLPDPQVITDDWPIGMAFFVKNESGWFDKVVEMPAGQDVILLDGSATVQRPEKTTLPPHGIASIVKTGDGAWAIWGDVNV